MSDGQNTQAVVPTKGKGHRFQPGHPQYGGRKKDVVPKRVELVRELALKLNITPGQLLLSAALYGHLPASVATDGTKIAAKTLSLEEQMKCLRDVMKFLEPSLAAMQITGRDGGPIELASMDVVELMRNPELARAAQTLALGVSTATREGIVAITNKTDDILDGETEELNTSPKLAP